MTSTRRKYSDRRVLIVLVGVLIMIVAMGWVLSGSWRDAQNLRWERCEVTDVGARQGGRYASVPWYVRFETADCGIVTYTIGTNADNVDALVEVFEPGPYEFKLGSVGQRAIRGQTFLTDVAEAKNVRRVPSDT